MEKFAKIYRLGSEVKEFDINGYDTVKEACTALGIEIRSGEAVKINGAAATLDSPMEDGDVILIVPQVKGGC